MRSAYSRPSGLVNDAVPAHGVAQVDLAADDVAPVRGVRVLEVGQPHLGAGVQRVDHHLALGRPGDLDPAVGEVGRRRRDLPVAGADVGGLGQEVEPPGARDLGPALGAGACEQLVAGGGEAPVQLGDEVERVGR